MTAISTIPSLTSLTPAPAVNNVTGNTSIGKIATAPAATTAPADQTSGTSTPFGPAVEINLSAPAKAIADVQNTAPANGTAAPATASSTQNTSSNKPDIDAGGALPVTVASTPPSNSAPASSPSSSSNTAGGSPASAPVAAAASPVAYDAAATAVSSSRNRVALQVGVADANQLVDKKGNIDKIKLATLVAEQQQDTQSTSNTPNPNSLAG